MYILKPLPEQQADLTRENRLRFPIVGLPGGCDALWMKIYAKVCLKRSTSHGAGISVEDLVGLISNVRMEAYGETIIGDMSYEELITLAAFHGSGMAQGLNDVDPAPEDRWVDVEVVVPFADLRQDEAGSLYDLAADTSLLGQGGFIDITIGPIGTPTDVISAIAYVGAIFYVMPRAGVYARPWKRYRKVYHSKIAGVQLDRGCFFDIAALDNSNTEESATPLGSDMSAYISAEYDGRKFIDSIRIPESNIIQIDRHPGSGYFQTMQGAHIMDRLVIVHTQANEVSELTKMRRSPNSEGLLNLTTPHTPPTGLTLLYCEIMPAGREHLLRVAQTYGLSSDSAVQVLGPESDAWMPKKLA